LAVYIYCFQRFSLRLGVLLPCPDNSSNNSQPAASINRNMPQEIGVMKTVSDHKLLDEAHKVCTEREDERESE
jgi:hypothetical protein